MSFNDGSECGDIEGRRQKISYLSITETENYWKYISTNGIKNISNFALLFVVFSMIVRAEKQMDLFNLSKIITEIHQ